MAFASTRPSSERRSCSLHSQQSALSFPAFGRLSAFGVGSFAASRSSWRTAWSARRSASTPWLTCTDGQGTGTGGPADRDEDVIELAQLRTLAKLLKREVALAAQLPDVQTDDTDRGE